MRSYIVYDGRALMDTDEAQILEYVGPRKSDKDAIAYARRCWNETDAVLYSYRAVDDELTDEQFVEYLLGEDK